MTTMMDRISPDLGPHGTSDAEVHELPVDELDDDVVFVEGIGYLHADDAEGLPSEPVKLHTQS